jgi:hypothetical protein
MLGEWYLPPGECQVILTITEGTISISHHAIQRLQTRIPQIPFRHADKFNTPHADPGPRSGGLILDRQGIIRHKWNETPGIEPIEKAVADLLK